jgi:hypothetical protein
LKKRGAERKEDIPSQHQQLDPIYTQQLQSLLPMTDVDILSLFPVAELSTKFSIEYSGVGST